MFTGIVEEMGVVRRVERTEGGRRLKIEAVSVIDDITVGASVSHSGVCLTVTEIGPDWYWVDAVAETLLRTTLGGLSEGDPVNLERPVRMADRLGGHLVQGHVDGVGEVEWCRPEGESTRVRVSAQADVVRYAVVKGSIAVDGVSLTVTAVDDNGFEVAVIPHTAAATTLGHRAPGDRVNIEVDVIAKYVERLVSR
jgi:riboflavin synthase